PCTDAALHQRASGAARSRGQQARCASATQGKAGQKNRHQKSGHVQAGERLMSTEPKHLARVPISVRWRDMDAMGHVNNAKYVSYLEEARVRWMLGVEGVSMNDRIAPVVAATNIN